MSSLQRLACSCMPLVQRDDSCLYMWMSHGALLDESCCASDSVVLHFWRSHVALLNQRCITLAQSVDSCVYTWMSHGALLNERCRTYEWGMCITLAQCVVWYLYIWMSLFALRNESCCTSEWEMYNIGAIFWLMFIHMNELCCASEWEMSYLWMRDVTWAQCFDSCVYTWMSHIALTNEKCVKLCHKMLIHIYIYQWVVSHTWRSSLQLRVCSGIAVAQYAGSCLHIWMSHVAHMNESCRTYGGVRSNDVCTAVYSIGTMRWISL